MEELGSLFENIRGKKLSDINVSEFLGSVFHVVRFYGVKLEGNFSTLLISIFFILLEM
jgi:hypothetical protein